MEEMKRREKLGEVGGQEGRGNVYWGGINISISSRMDIERDFELS